MSAQNSSGRVTRRICAAPVVLAAALAAPKLAHAFIYTENFDIKPVDWTALNNNTGGSNFGFQATNLTGGASGAGESGGTFSRSNIRGYYADTRLYGTLTQADFIHGEGELDFRNGATADTDHAEGHQNINTLGGNANIFGIGIFEGGEGGTPDTGFRFTYQIYNDGGSDLHGTRTFFVNGQYRYTYDWNPNNKEMTVKLFNSAGTQVHNESSGPLDITFQLNAYGSVSGMNGSVEATKFYEVRTDAQKYTTFMPKVTQRFDSSPANWQVLGGAPYGFSNTNNTGQESGAGEAGGVMPRDLHRKGYMDVQMQALSQAQPFGASGEFSWGSPNNPDNEVFICHQAKNQVDGLKEGDSTAVDQGGHNMAGLYILDETATTFRMIARVYDSKAVRYSSDNAVSVPAGTYKFDYLWDPGSLTLSCRILNTDGVTVVASNSVTLPSSAELDLDAFGLTTGFNGSFEPARNYSVFIDNVTYTAGHQWITDGNGTWGSNNRDSWDGPLPNGTDHVAYFGNKITAARTVTLDGGKTVGSMYFNSPNSYTIAGTDTITMEGAGTDSVSINVLAGSHTISAPIQLNRDLVINSAGSGVAITGNLTATGRTITKLGAGTAQLENVRADALTVSGGTLRVSAKGTPNSASGTSVVKSLTINAPGVLDLTNNSAIVDYDSVGSLVDDTRQNLSAGRLTSSSATLARGLGYADNATLDSVKTTFGGQTVDASSLLIKYTYFGDADLDGDVDVADLGKLATAWQTSNNWQNGDFDYNGTVNVNDLGLLATDWQLGVGNPLGPSSLSEALASLGLPSVAVPEPMGLAALGSLALAGLARRSRRKAEFR